jgi:phenylpyruvate tautomerase PptA (4-oxalocrotonate tautomerase family)
MIHMPVIHIKALAGRSKETQLKAAESIVSTASEIMGAPKEAFTVTYEEFANRDEFEEKVVSKEVTPRQDKVLINHGVIVKN